MKKILPILLVLTLSACGRPEKGNGIIVDDSAIASCSDADSGTMRHAYDLVLQTADNYRHPNEKLLDKLFPGWQDDGIKVRLIVGSPVQEGTFVETSPEGISGLALNLAALSAYHIDDESLRHNLESAFSHEFVHIIMRNRGYGKSQGDDYLSALNSLAYHEGFANLLSYNTEGIGGTDWKAERGEYFEPSRVMLETAMAEDDPEQQSMYVRKADTGYYYDRFASVSSMLYLSQIYERKGVKGLKRELNRGSRNICKRITRMKCTKL